MFKNIFDNYNIHYYINHKIYKQYKNSLLRYKQIKFLIKNTF